MNHDITTHAVLTLRVNGKEYGLAVSPDRTLLDVLREELGLVGAREGCGIGMCGACTVLVNGRVISSCLVLAVQAQNKEIITVEGLGMADQLHPVQQAYLDYAAFQCAYCTPGFILTTVALLAEIPNPDDETIRHYLAGNLCRCGSYMNILEAVQHCRQSASA
ncbi:MAG: (2Fe-2S)-binding protein [Chloroflexi bacterium]|nr:(2Fe-2S)-binding protein [Chloroflexota bacterium]